jgi:hypothetical protein
LSVFRITEWTEYQFSKESQALAERLRFVIGLDPKSPLRMNASETLLQLGKKVPRAFSNFP